MSEHEKEVVSSETLTAALLIDMRDFLANMTPSGTVETLKVTVSSSQPLGTTIDLKKKYGRNVFGVSIKNLGTDVVFFGINRVAEINPDFNASVEANDKVDINYNAAVIRTLNLRTTGNCTVKLYVSG